MASVTLNSPNGSIVLTPEDGVGEASITLPRVGYMAADAITGTVLQTVHKKVDTRATYAFATAGQTGTYISALDTTITPSSTSSRIIINFNLSYEVHHDTIFRLYRGSTEILRNTTDANYWSGWKNPGYDADTNSTPRTTHFMDIDSPNTTSAITYRLMIQSAGVGASTFYLNRTVASAGANTLEAATSTIILQEIAS